MHFIMLDIVFRALSLDGIPREGLTDIENSARDALHRLPERFSGNPGWGAFLDFHPGELMELVDLVSKYGNDAISDQAARFLEGASQAWRRNNMARNVVPNLESRPESSQ